MRTAERVSVGKNETSSDICRYQLLAGYRYGAQMLLDPGYL